MKESEDNTKRTPSEDKRITDTDQRVQNISNLPKDQIRQTERAVERTFEDTRTSINRVTEEARRGISKSTEQMREYQEDSINIINNIANNFIALQKEFINNFSDSFTRNDTQPRTTPQMPWFVYYSPERLAQIYGESIHNFTNSLIKYGNLLNNLTISNMNYFKSFLQQMEIYSKEFSEKEKRK
jgi:flagellar biosynthesis GTPase FlhF